MSADSDDYAYLAGSLEPARRCMSSRDVDLIAVLLAGRLGVLDPTFDRYAFLRAAGVEKCD